MSEDDKDGENTGIFPDTSSGEISDSTPSKCEFYNKDYCIPCKSPETFYECEMVKIGNQIKLDKDGSDLK